jgi:hypothetical protein
VRVHAVVALALPAVEAFDLAIPAQVFGDHRLGKRYSFTVCAPARGLVPSNDRVRRQAGRSRNTAAPGEATLTG